MDRRSKEILKPGIDMFPAKPLLPGAACLTATLGSTSALGALGRGGSGRQQGAAATMDQGIASARHTPAELFRRPHGSEIKEPRGIDSARV